MRTISGRAVVVVAILLAGAGAVILNLSIRSENRAAGSACAPTPTATGSLGATARRLVVAARSRPAVPGIPCRVPLLAPCVPLVDFDGRLWRPSGSWSRGGPLAPATVELQDRRHALLESASGGSIALVPADAPLSVPPCPAPPAA